MHNRHRRDSNHSAIKAHLQSIPALELKDVSQYGGFGCDLMIFYKAKVYFVEIKSKGERNHLTKSELALCDLCLRRGYAYIVAETSEEILREIGAI